MDTRSQILITPAITRISIEVTGTDFRSNRTAEGPVRWATTNGSRVRLERGSGNPGEEGERDKGSREVWMIRSRGKLGGMQLLDMYHDFGYMLMDGYSGVDVDMQM